MGGEWSQFGSDLVTSLRCWLLLTFEQSRQQQQQQPEKGSSYLFGNITNVGSYLLGNISDVRTEPWFLCC